MKMRSKFSRRIRFAEDPVWYNCTCGYGYSNASGICPNCGKHNAD